MGNSIMRLNLKFNPKEVRGKHTLQAFCDVVNDVDHLRAVCPLVVDVGGEKEKIGVVYRAMFDPQDDRCIILSIRLNENFTTNFELPKVSQPVNFKFEMLTGLIVAVRLENWQDHFVARRRV